MPVLTLRDIMKSFRVSVVFVTPWSIARACRCKVGRVRACSIAEKRCYSLATVQCFKHESCCLERESTQNRNTRIASEPLRLHEHGGNNKTKQELAWKATHMGSSMRSSWAVPFLCRAFFGCCSAVGDCWWTPFPSALFLPFGSCSPTRSFGARCFGLYLRSVDAEGGTEEEGAGCARREGPGSPFLGIPRPAARHRKAFTLKHTLPAPSFKAALSISTVPGAHARASVACC